MCPIKSVSSTSSRKLPRRCRTPWSQPARNSATAFPSSRGRPRKAERAQSRKATRQQQQVSKLFEHRYLFVQHRLTADQKTTLQRITCGLAHLRRLRQIMEEVYRLFDRRCRTETAPARLAQLRGRVSRCKRLGRVWTSFPARTWRRRRRSWMTNSCRRPAMRWNEVTGAIARHKRASTQCGRLNTFASVSPWTCSGISSA